MGSRASSVKSWRDCFAVLEREFSVMVGKAECSDVVKGEAMMETKGLTDAIVERGSGKISCLHIIG